MSLQESVLSGLTRVGVAVSGGADSVFLLHALADRGLASAVLHVNHKLRGEESELDERFVRDLAAELGLPFFTAAMPIGGGNIEQEARRARYAFFEAQIKAGHCEAVATGHNKDDQAETVLGRFLRGAGTAGLSGIRPKTANGMVRPLLGLRRKEIRASLRERGIAWREDASNANTSFLRNRLRHEIMPLLETLNPSLADVLASTSEWARAEEDHWDVELRPVLQFKPNLFRTAHITALSIAAQRRIIRLILASNCTSLLGIDFRHVEAVRALISQTEGSGRIQLPGLDIYRSFDWVRIAKPGIDSILPRDFEIPLSIPGVVEIPERGIRLEMERSGMQRVPCKEHVYNEEVYALDEDRCNGSLSLRNWRPGDRLQPAGRTGDEKIKTLFQENRVPLWERRNWPVIVSDDSIVWTRRFGADARFVAGEQSTRILTVRESKPSAPASIVAEGQPVFHGAGQGSN